MTPECRICLGRCDREIHAATLRVRKWFRSTVLPKPVAKPTPKSKAVSTSNPILAERRYTRSVVDGR